MDLTLEDYLLGQATSMPEDRAYDVLKEVGADIEIKLDHCLQHPKRMGSSVRLSVKVKGSNVDGWQVFHVLVGRKEFLGDTGEPLQKLSNPAEGPVPVGRHFLWAKKGSITTDPQVYRIGLGKDDQEIEIPVP
jgi:hypothetical protein